jgi:uncharacterized protein with beta-barrel porin domain
MLRAFPEATSWNGNGMREVQAGGRGGCAPDDDYRISVAVASSSLALAFAIVLSSGEVARADCTPQAGNNVTATCTGTTNGQGAGAPGSSGSVYGFGSGVETGMTVTVAAGAANTVTGANAGIAAGGVTVTNNAGASITGGNDGIDANLAGANVTNSGSIAGSSNMGISGSSVTVTNSAGASITGGLTGIWGLTGVSVTNSGSITGASSGIYSGQSVTVTNNAGASITGGTYGIYAGAGGSSVFSAGSISGVVAIAFGGSGNTLTLAPGSATTGMVFGTGNDTLQLGGVGAASFDVSQIDPSAQYQGFGTFNKIGSSTWTLTGTSTFAGPVTVDAGTLSVNGNIASASSVTVNAGGTLGGNGIVGNTTINGGTLSPGNSIGLLTVQGNLAFTSAASYLVEVSPANADRTNVTGTATLGGATVNTSFAAGSYVSKQYTILNATGGVSGTFGSLTNSNLPSNFAASLSYDANNVFLNLALNFTPPSAPDFGRGLNVNQRNVGNALTNFFNTTGGIPLVFGTLTPAGLTQISGETATGSQQTTFGAMSQFMGVMTDPFSGGRGDTAPAGATPYAEEDALAYASNGTPRAKNASDAYPAIFRKAPTAAIYEPRWNVWAAGFGGSQTTNGDTTLGSSDTTSRIAASAVGADYRFSPDTVAGFALAGGGTSFSVTNGGSGRSDLFQAGAFVRHTEGAAYITAAAAYGWQDITTDRTVTVAGLDRLHAEFNANAYSGRVEGGYRFLSPWIGGIGITPYAAAQATTFVLPAYAESALVGTNAFALAYNATSVTDTRSEVGLRTDKSYALSNAILTLRGRFAWAYDFNPDRSIAATFQTLPGASFVVNGAAQAHDSALTTASAEVKWMNGWSAAATFEGEFSEVTRSYAGKGVVRYQW